MGLFKEVQVKWWQDSILYLLNLENFKKIIILCVGEKVVNLMYLYVACGRWSYSDLESKFDKIIKNHKNVYYLWLNDPLQKFIWRKNP